MPGTGANRPHRRDTLLEAAAAIVADGDVESLSMETVATRAGVSRPLVYKHFANRGELLAAVYRREAAALDAEIVAVVEQADGLEDVVRTMVQAIFRGDASRGNIFATLQRAGARDASVRDEQRARDRRTVRFFAKLAAQEFGLELREAKAAMSILLRGVDALLIQRRAHRGPQEERFLEDVYVALALGGLNTLATSHDRLAPERARAR
jgi:AcrR family transcriptional regulator